jgi:hydrogenase nickel incorporation protein HypB
MAEEQSDRVERVIELNDDLLANNENLARKNSELLNSFGIKTIDVVGAIGAGKTLILEKIVERLAPVHRILVINGDVTLRIDADRIEKWGAKCIQINTGRECALNAYHVHSVITKFDVSKYDLLLIENVGNLICPSDFILGTDFARVVIVSITEGEHVIRKHPMLFKMSRIALINKIDLLPYIDGVDVERMRADALEINPDITVINTSARTGEGLDELISALDLASPPEG